MKTLFMVTQGEYSDYCVMGIFSTREKAELAHKLYMADNEIEEITLDDIPEHPPGHTRYMVRMYRDGNNQVRQVPAGDGVDGWVYQDVTPYDGYANNGKGVGAMNIYCWAESPEGAAKIANEKRVRAIVGDYWITNFTDWRKFLLSKGINV